MKKVLFKIRDEKQAFIKKKREINIYNNGLHKNVLHVRKTNKSPR